MLGKTAYSFIISLIVIFVLASNTSFSFVVQEGDKTFIIDQTGERWDISQAKSIGFKPKGFQYGIGRNAFTPLDDSYLTEDSLSVSGKLRVIGVTDGSQAQAYSVSKLMHHEIANTRIGSNPIMVGY